MKTINEFFTSENNVWVLSMVELKSVKGGDEPPSDPLDLFKKKN
jgi:hypothetical protein